MRAKEKRGEESNVVWPREQRVNKVHLTNGQSKSEWERERSGFRRRTAHTRTKLARRSKKGRKTPQNYQVRTADAKRVKGKKETITLFHWFPLSHQRTIINLSDGCDAQRRDASLLLFLHTFKNRGREEIGLWITDHGRKCNHNVLKIIHCLSEALIMPTLYQNQDY